MMNSSGQIWAKAILPQHSNVKQAVQILNETSLKIVLVVGSNGALIGTISDGDIRRGLLKGLELSSSIDSIVHREALVVPSDLNHTMVVQLMIANRIQQIPIVDNDMRVIGMHLWDEINAPPIRTNTMVIMAGGKGTRLQPHTDNCPKPLLPVSGKPILEHIIDRAKAEGFSRFILSIHYLGHMIEDYFGNGDSLGVEIGYLREELPLGTAGALSLLDPIPDSPFLVTNGDVLTDIHYGELLDFHLKHNAIATMAVRMNEWQNPYGVVQTQGVDITGYEEKPLSRTQINAGVYVIEPEVINLLDKGFPCDMPSLFKSIRDRSMRTIAYPVHEQWLDVGAPDEFEKASHLNYLTKTKESKNKK
jgi:dTDP-glucose pyrophosphorylase